MHFEDWTLTWHSWSPRVCWRGSWCCPCWRWGRGAGRRRTDHSPDITIWYNYRNWGMGTFNVNCITKGMLFVGIQTWDHLLGIAYQKGIVVTGKYRTKSKHKTYVYLTSSSVPSPPRQMARWTVLADMLLRLVRERRTEAPSSLSQEDRRPAATRTGSENSRSTSSTLRPVNLYVQQPRVQVPKSKLSFCGPNEDFSRVFSQWKSIVIIFN